MVALNEKFHHNGTIPITLRELRASGQAVRSNRCRAGKSAQSEKSVDRPLITPPQHPPFSSAASLCKSVNPSGPMYCGYPDNKRLPREIGTGLNDPETQLYYVRKRCYSPAFGTVLRQEPKSRWPAGATDREIQRDPIGYPDETQGADNESGQAFGGINLYEYVAGRAVVAVDPTGTLVVPGMPIPLPMHGAGPLKTWRGAIHDLGRGADGKCCFYVNTHYSQDLGTILTNGWSPTGEDWQAYVAPMFDILAKLTEVGGLVSELLSGTTFDTALCAYEAKVSFIKTRVFTYTCCKRYQNPVWESTTVKDVHFSFWSLGSIQSVNLNILLPGSNERLIDAIKEWGAELLKHFVLEASP